MAAVAKSESRLTRARSKDVDSTPTSPIKKQGRPRRGRSASVEQQALDNMQQAQPNFNAQALGAIPEIDENMMAAQLGSAPPAPENNNSMAMGNFPTHPPYQDFASATSEAMKSVRSRRPGRVAKNARQPAAQAAAPQAPMLQEMAQHAQHANQMQPPMEQQMNLVDPQLENPAQAEAKQSIFARQEGAMRLGFDDSQPQQVHQHMAPQADMGEMGATQDEGFQTDSRSLPSVPPRRRRGPRQQPPQDNNQTYEPASAANDERQSSPRPSPPPSNYAQVQQQAKLYTATLRRDKVPQKRKAWTSEECDALIDGIGQFGNGYATLKAEDNKHRKFLHDRSAEDLRHKARNMKFDYLKAGVALPAGFDAVLLDKKFQDKLAAMGREYHQVQMRQPKRQKTKHALADKQGENGVDESQAAPQ